PLLLLRLGLTRARRQFLRLGELQLGLGLVETRRRSVVERLVAPAADVVREADLQARAAGGGRVAALRGRTGAVLASATGGGHGDQGARENGGAQSANSIAEQGDSLSAEPIVARAKERTAT